jgi:hypothetical protein
MEKRFLGAGIDTEKFPCRPVMEELRLLANTIKHAEGDSAEKLRRCAPELFQRPRYFDSSEVLNSASADVFTPLLGDDIYVKASDIHRYKEAITLFWRSLAERLCNI